MRSNSRFEYAEERIGIPEDMSIEIIQSEEKKGKKGKENKESLRDLWDSIKQYS